MKGGAGGAPARGGDCIPDLVLKYYHKHEQKPRCRERSWKVGCHRSPIRVGRGGNGKETEVSDLDNETQRVSSAGGSQGGGVLAPGGKGWRQQRVRGRPVSRREGGCAEARKEDTKVPGQGGRPASAGTRGLEGSVATRQNAGGWGLVGAGGVREWWGVWRAAGSPGEEQSGALWEGTGLEHRRGHLG